MKRYNLPDPKFPHHQVVLYDSNNKPFLDVRRNTKKEIVEKLKEVAFSKAYLKVTYEPECWNDITVNSWDDLLDSWNNFMEPSLLAYIKKTKKKGK